MTTYLLQYQCKSNKCGCYLCWQTMGSFLKKSEAKKQAKRARRTDGLAKYRLRLLRRVETEVAL